MRMDDGEHNLKYSSKVYGLNNQQDYSSLLCPKVFTGSVTYPRPSNQYMGGKEDVEDEELGNEEEGTNNGVRMIGNDTYDDDDDDDDDEDEDEDDEDEDEDDEDEDGNGKMYNGKAEDIAIGHPRKKRKLKTLISNYELVRRVPTPSAHQAPSSRPPSSGQNSVGDWKERETFAFLDAWGDQFLKLGRKSLGSKEWQEAEEKVLHETNIERIDTQCRNQLDTLKKKYKKEKMRLKASKGGASKWVFYKKIDMLMSSPPQQQASLSCGIDSGEYVFMNPKVYLNRANGLDEMRDSPGNSESEANEEDRLHCKGQENRRRRVEGSSFRLLADSIKRFGEIYEKIENKKRKQMVDLENMRMDFQRELEMQRRQILERAQAEIAKIRQEGDDENDLCVENLSG